LVSTQHPSENEISVVLTWKLGSSCQTNDGKNTTRFLPTFPASCPYVTSVGSTQYVQPEEATIFSGGGFSDRFPRPAYQNTAVSSYLKKLGTKWQNLYNAGGRGFPDVAAQGMNFHVIDKNGTNVQLNELFSGTSASAPTFAAIVSLLNNARLSEGQAPLGFLNPWLYSVGYKGLTDIVNGGSVGCIGEAIFSGLPAPVVPFASFNATKGWDPVSGLGTPLFDKLLQLAVPKAPWNCIEGKRY
jgi:tripeptidyl-peptidase-1